MICNIECSASSMRRSLLLSWVFVHVEIIYAPFRLTEVGFALLIGNALVSISKGRSYHSSLKNPDN